MSNMFLLIAFCLSMFGTVLAIFCYLPGVIKTFKYNDTRSISTLMFSLATFGCLVWIAIGIFLIVGYSQTNGQKNDLIFSLASGFGTLFSNLGLGTCSLLILIKKINNILKAKKLKMSENEYYKKIIEPVVTEKIAKQKKLKQEAKEKTKTICEEKKEEKTTDATEA